MGQDAGRTGRGGRRARLPARLTSFVGRAGELAGLEELLGRRRLVTVVGPGGSGKTRLAVETARRLAGRFEDGAYMVELAQVDSGTGVGATVASVLGVPEHRELSMVQAVAAAVGDRHLLLLLDNCEHVAGGAAEFCAALLSAGEDLRVVATSRSPLGVDGEQVFRLEPLPVPGSDPPGAAGLAGCDSVELFVDRAAAHRPDFTLDDNTGAAVASICRHLDGIPLAIELAAGRLRSMSLADVEAKLSDRFRLLTGGHRASLPHQRTLKASIDWSYELLDSHQQTVLRRLSQFAGAWRLDAAGRVCADATLDEADVADCVAALVDQSLVEMDPTGPAAVYRLLETIREYASERLDESGEAARVAAAHAREYLALAERAAGHLRGPAQGDWLARLDGEMDNIRLAGATLLTGDGTVEEALRLVGALRWYWDIRGRYREAVELGEAVLGRADAPSAPRLWAHALLALLWLKVWTGELALESGRAAAGLRLARAHGDGAAVAEYLLLEVWDAYVRADSGLAVRAMVDESLDLARRSGDRHLLGRVMAVAPAVFGRDKGTDPNANLDLMTEAAGIFRELGDRHWLGVALNNVASQEMDDGDLAAAGAHLDEAVAALSALQADSSVLSLTHYNAGVVQLLQGDLDGALRSLSESLVLAHRVGGRDIEAIAVLGMALHASARGDHRRAASLHALTAALHEQLGQVIQPGDARLADQDLARIRAHLTAQAYEQAFAEGLELAGRWWQTDRETRAALVLTGPEPDSRPHRPERRPGDPDLPGAALSRRERQLLGLLVEGLTDREIGERMFISLRTVRSHLDRIRDKTGCRRRAELSRLATRMQLSGSAEAVTG